MNRLQRVKLKELVELNNWNLSFFLVSYSWEGDISFQKQLHNFWMASALMNSYISGKISNKKY